MNYSDLAGIILVVRLESHSYIQFGHGTLTVEIIP